MAVLTCTVGEVKPVVNTDINNGIRVSLAFVVDYKVGIFRDLIPPGVFKIIEDNEGLIPGESHTFKNQKMPSINLQMFEAISSKEPFFDYDIRFNEDASLKLVQVNEDSNLLVLKVKFEKLLEELKTELPYKLCWLTGMKILGTIVNIDRLQGNVEKSIKKMTDCVDGKDIKSVELSVVEDGEVKDSVNITKAGVV